MEYVYLPEEAYIQIRRHLVKFLQQQHKRFMGLSLELEKNTLQVNTNSDDETSAIIKIIGELHKVAQISVGVTKVTVLQNNREVFFIGLELKSSEITISRGTMTTSVLEKAIQVDNKQLDTDSLQALAEICTTSGIEPEAIENYLLSSEGNGRKINVFLIKEEKVIPTKQIQPLLQGFFNWLSTSQLQVALAALGEANILTTNGSNGKASQGATKTAQTPSKVATKSDQEKQPRSPYKIPTDFKPKTSYQKTLEALLNHQGEKAKELLRNLDNDEPIAVKFLERVSKKYNKPEAAMKNLMSLVKDKLHELETETSNSAD